MRIAMAFLLAAVICTTPAWAAGAPLGERDPDWQYVLVLSFYHDGELLSRQGMLVMDGTVSTSMLQKLSLAARMAPRASPYAVPCAAAVLIYARQPWTVEDYLGNALRDPAMRRACDAASHFTFLNLEIAIYRPDADWAEVTIRRVSMNNPHGICLAEYHEDMDPGVLAMLEDCGALGVRLSGD